MPIAYIEFALPEWEMSAEELSAFLAELEPIGKINVAWTGVA